MAKLSLTVLLVVAFFSGISSATDSPAGCSSADYRVLDFWVGNWKVVNPKGQLEGHNRIEKVLKGCAIMEHWTDASGGQGKSLFYFQPITKSWKQVWVTDSGPIKEKSLLADYPGPSVRFQGELPRRNGSGTYLDRTTLSPEANGKVRQVIEVSLDGGKTWPAEYRWEGIYVKESGKSH